MAVALRYIRSDLFNNANVDGVQAASSIAVDVAGYLQTERHYIGDYEGRIRAGFNIKNIGPKLDYSSSEDNQSYLPTNLGIGGVYDLYLDDYNRISGGIEANKLLVPTPDTIDSDNDGVYDYRTKPVLGGMVSSFGDAPGGFNEELKEYIWTTISKEGSDKSGAHLESWRKGQNGVEKLNPLPWLAQ